ncbi:MAG: hypothetical protein LBI37_00390 [Puniceicoccales bacterium]|jgi:DNA-binding phage protein|nr:hypothetical protein [Puniceicoccales bacterium]
MDGYSDKKIFIAAIMLMFVQVSPYSNGLPDNKSYDKMSKDEKRVFQKYVAEEAMRKVKSKNPKKWHMDEGENEKHKGVVKMAIQNGNEVPSNKHYNQMSEYEKIVFKKYVAEKAAAESYKLKEIRDKKLEEEKQRYDNEIYLLKSQEPDIFNLLKDRLDSITTISLDNPIDLVQLTKEQKFENFPRPNITPAQYKNIIVQETHLPSVNEQKILQRDLKSAFAVSLDISENLRKIARGFHEKKAEIFKNQPKMERVFDELFEQIDAKVFAIRSEELGPYISDKSKLDQIKILALRGQESYLRTQYQVMEFLGNLLDDQNPGAIKATLDVFEELSIYNGVDKPLADIVKNAFGYEISECPNVMVDSHFAISMDSILKETGNKFINEARRITARRANLKKDSAFMGLVESVEVWRKAVKNINERIANFYEKISLPQDGSKLLDPQLRGHFIKMIDRSPFSDLFDISYYKDVPTMAKGILIRMPKEVLDSIRTFNQCRIQSYESSNFFKALGSFIDELLVIPSEVRRLQEKIAEVRNFLIEYK